MARCMTKSTATALGGCPDQDVQVREQQDERNRDGHPEEQPAGLGGDPGDDGPRQAGDHDADDGQLGIVGELEVDVPPGRGENRRADHHQHRVGRQRPGNRQDGGDYHPGSRRLLAGRGEIHAEQAQRAPQ